MAKADKALALALRMSAVMVVQGQDELGYSCTQQEPENGTVGGLQVEMPSQTMDECLVCEAENSGQHMQPSPPFPPPGSPLMLLYCLQSPPAFTGALHDIPQAERWGHAPRNRDSYARTEQSVFQCHVALVCRHVFMPRTGLEEL